MSNPAAAQANAELRVEQPAERSRSARRRAQLENRIVLVAVCALVFLVSLPRLQGIAMRENELDAQQALTLLARELGARMGASEIDGAPAPTHIGELLPPDATLSRRLGDLELLAAGRLALRHGYLFELVLPAEGEAFLRAWPWRLGSSGETAFLARPGAHLLAHPNPPGPGAPRWSGLERRPVGDGALEAGWQPVRLPGSRSERY